ncbi:phosphoenolpyruvate synthase [Candidatus Woesearchaeota archaeon CG10_big_fil_rev_8_21_14_0_10_30_7]|nr:MAG: phosphoenolpyruvate synthase [Candidatus Woesearchaeota archaeon CG10_big_fil_rev_8_21_14_0_10_30_7]
MKKEEKFVLWFKEIGIEDVPIVGGKNASLGEMYRYLSTKGVSIPDGFAITATAYKYFVKKARIDEEIKKILNGLKRKNIKDLAERGRRIRNLITHAELPADLKKDILTNYHLLCKKYKEKEVDTAIRSSATAEDLPDASFAGQQETFLNVRGEHELLDSCKKCFASLFTDRAIVYREEKGFDHFQVYLSIAVQKMVRSDLASSGVMFSIDTESGFRNAVLINGSYGLGENIVQGAVTPDEFYVFKPTLNKYKPIISKKLGTKSIRMVYGVGGTKELTKNVTVPEEERKQFCITDQEVLQLAKWAVIIEEYYTKKRNKFTPMDIEWAKDGISEKIFIVQARPETVQSQKKTMQLEEYILKKKGIVLVTGRAIGERIGAGKANVIRHVKDISQFKPGQILITEMTDPDWVVIMRQASAIVTNRGGSTSHAAIVSRELGIPCIVGTNNATQKIKSGQTVTVSCSEGETGKVYNGALPFTIKKTDLTSLPRTKTKIMINLGNPEEAFKYSFLPVEGVGLAREEFIINEYIKIHPLALLKFNELKDERVKAQIEELTSGYKDKKQFFIDKLAMGVGMIAAAFYPHDVIVRMSDFKSNEYANLIGGTTFEPKEENPMLGWRGASRYYTSYKDAFVLECKAMKKAREEFGLNNIKLMIPMCRTIEEGTKVLQVMNANGLVKGKNNLEVYVMCEVPSNVVLAEEFCKIFDGFSIGSNDLTQLTLGVDRDSSLVAHVFNERNDAVKWMVKHVIDIAKKNKKKIGICGDAPSTYLEFATFLVECGINSISLSPDAVVKTLLHVAEVEKRMKKST